METSPMAQDLIRCELCPDKHHKSPTELVCKTCHIYLCSECVGKHVSSELTIEHNVVGFEFQRSYMQSISCKIHPKSTCELHCQDCSVPVCVKCLADVSHKNHDLVEISSIYDAKKDTIKQDTEELKNLIVPTYETIIKDLETQKLKISESYKNINKSILKQGNEWHKEVDVTMNKLFSLVEQMQKNDLSLLTDLQSEITNILSSIRETIQENQNYLDSLMGTKVMDYKSRNQEFKRVPLTFDLSIPCFLPMEIQGGKLSQMFGELKPSKKIDVPAYSIQESYVSTPSAKQFLNQPKVYKTMSCTLKAARISCVPSTKAFYIKYDNIIKHINNSHGVLREFKTKSGSRSYINLSVTGEKKLVYTDYRDRSVNIVNGEKIDTIIRLQDWRPLAVCCTSSDELLVSMRSDNKFQSKVVRYNQFKATQEIQFDTVGYRLYRDPQFLAENKNFQVCVSDYQVRTVIVTNKTGELIFRYNGNISSDKYKTFTPGGITTDSACHILVADRQNKCIHIINHDGRFIRYIDNCNLSYPLDLSISHDDTLYIADLQRSVTAIKYLHHIQ